MPSVSACRRAAQYLPAAPPGGQRHEQRSAMPSGSQPPETTLTALAPRKPRSMTRNAASSAPTSRHRPAPAEHHHHRDQQAVDQHGAGHGDAVGRRQTRRRAEAEHQQQHAGQQHPVDDRDVDLAALAGRGVADAQARQIAQTNRLLRQREGARDHRLRGDDRGRRGEHHQRRPQPVRAPAGKTGFAPPPGRPAAARPGRSSSASAPATPPRTSPGESARRRSGPCRRTAPRCRSPPAPPRPAPRRRAPGGGTETQCRTPD